MLKLTQKLDFTRGLNPIIYNNDIIVFLKYKPKFKSHENI